MLWRNTNCQIANCCCLGDYQTLFQPFFFDKPTWVFFLSNRKCHAVQKWQIVLNKSDYIHIFTDLYLTKVHSCVVCTKSISIFVNFSYGKALKMLLTYDQIMYTIEGLVNFKLKFISPAWLNKHKTQTSIWIKSQRSKIPFNSINFTLSVIQ